MKKSLLFTTISLFSVCALASCGSVDAKVAIKEYQHDPDMHLSVEGVATAYVIFDTTATDLKNYQPHEVELVTSDSSKVKVTPRINDIDLANSYWIVDISATGSFTVTASLKGTKFNSITYNVGPARPVDGEYRFPTATNFKYVLEQYDSQGELGSTYENYKVGDEYLRIVKINNEIKAATYFRKNNNNLYDRYRYHADTKDWSLLSTEGELRLVNRSIYGEITRDMPSEYSSRTIEKIKVNTVTTTSSGEVDYDVNVYVTSEGTFKKYNGPEFSMCLQVIGDSFSYIVKEINYTVAELPLKPAA